MEQSKEKLNKLDNFNQFLLANNLSNNATASIWKKEILASYKSEKTARRDLRNKQSKLSKHLLTVILTKNEVKINEAKKILTDFYKFTLIDKSKFSNRNNEGAEFKEIQQAYELIKKDI